MANEIERKLYFYKLKLERNSQVQNLYDFFKNYSDNLFKNDYKNLEQRGLVYNHKKDAKLYFLAVKHIDKKKANCILYSLRYGAFPYLFNLIEGKENIISNNSNDTLMEQTHFSIFFDEDLIISEYNHNGPRISSLRLVLTTIFKDITKLDILPLLLPEEYRNFEKVSKVDYVDLKVGIPGASLLKQYANLDIDFDFNSVFENCDDLQIDIKISSCKRTGLQLKNSKSFFDRLIYTAQKKLRADFDQSNDIAKELKSMSIKASIDSDDKSLPINLLEDKLLSVVKIPKLNESNTKYLDSSKMFESLDESYKSIYLKVYKKDITIDEEVACGSVND